MHNPSLSSNLYQAQLCPENVQGEVSEEAEWVAGLERDESGDVKKEDLKKEGLKKKGLYNEGLKREDD